MATGKKILLAYPPTRRLLREDRCQIPSKNVIMAPPLPPTDLLSLAAVAERCGAECRVVDYTSAGRTESDFLRDLAEFSPDFLLVTVATPTLDADLLCCALAKQSRPGLVTIAKGAHFLKFSRRALDAWPGLDLAIFGEPEMTFQDVISGKSPQDIPGLAWRGPQGAVVNPGRAFIEDLDSLPFPARHLIDNRQFIRPDTGEPQTVVRVSRGCPYHCFFCLATPLHGAKVRMRSSRSIMEEIAGCVERYGIRNFVFWSDFFTFDRAWVLGLCSEIERSGLRITWSANTRADALDRELAAAMKRAGCTLVSIGVESGSPGILDRAGKGISLPQLRSAFATLRSARLSSLAYYLVGLPWETRETALETMRLARELDSDYASFFVATPFPGTRFYDFAEAEGLFDEGGTGQLNAYEHAYTRPVARGLFLDRDEIAGLRRQAERRFYLRPGYILRTLRRVRSPRELSRYASAAFGMLRGDG